MWRSSGNSLRDGIGTKLGTHHRRGTCIRGAIVLKMRVRCRLRRMLSRLIHVSLEARISSLLWSLRTRIWQHPRRLTGRCAQTIFSRSRSFRRNYRVCLVDRIVESWRGISHPTIVHSLLHLGILELGRIDVIVWSAHKRCRVEHVSSHVRVVEEGRAIVILDGSGVIHPGAHVCEAERQPICIWRGEEALAHSHYLKPRGTSSIFPMESRWSRPGWGRSRSIATRLMVDRTSPRRGNSQPQPTAMPTVSSDA